MFEWGNELPAWRFALYCSGFLVLLTWLGIIFVRPIFRLWIGSQPGANDLVGHATSAFSLFYGLLLGLLSVATYQNLERIQGVVNNEAATLPLIYRNVAYYPEPIRSEVQYLLRDYTLYVLNEDWPAHRRGEIPQGGSHRLQTIRGELLAFEPTTKTDEILHESTLNDFDVLLEQRQQRLAGVRTAIPGAMWYAVAIGAVVNIVLLWMLNMRLRIHFLLSGLVAFFLGVMIFLIASMDNPMRGEVSASPEPFRLAYDLVMKWDEEPGIIVQQGL